MLDIFHFFLWPQLTCNLQALRAALPEELAGASDELLTTPEGLCPHARLQDSELAAALLGAPALDTSQKDYLALIEAVQARMAASAASDPCPPQVLLAPAADAAAAAAAAAWAAPAHAPPAGHTVPPRFFSAFYMPLLHLLQDPRSPYPQAQLMRADLERCPRLYEPVLAVVEAARRVPGLRAALRQDLQAAADAALAQQQQQQQQQQALAKEGEAGQPPDPVLAVHMDAPLQDVYLQLAGQAEALALQAWLTAEYARGGGHAFGLVPCGFSAP
jgi:hypothetical protein